MINVEEFTKRLQKIMDYYGETASSFAEKINVQRSSISHILSGRNKPSLEFVLKILASYPDVELYWLLNGKGEFPYSENNIKEVKQKEIEFEKPSTPIEKEIKKENTIPVVNKQIDSEINNNDKIIERIVIFYSDGSFKNFQN